MAVRKAGATLGSPIGRRGVECSAPGDCEAHVDAIAVP
jgi:hypothetical protein